VVESCLQESLLSEASYPSTKITQDVGIRPSIIFNYAKPTRSYYNATTKSTIDYYEIEVKEFEQQVYPGLKKAKLVGYDGMSPGPTFRMEKDKEAVVRFINHAKVDFSVHLHGSYSEFYHKFAAPRMSH
jgi:hypothetical protein